MLYHRLYQVQLILLLVVAGTIGAPARYRVGFSHGASGRTGFKAGANADGTIEQGVADGSVSGKLGASGNGAIEGGVFVQAGDKIAEAGADYNVSGGGWINPGATGVIGRNTETGQFKLGGDGKWRSYGEQRSSGSAGINTGVDALYGYNKARDLTADDILKEMDNF